MEHDALIRPVQTLTEPHKSQINTGLVSSYPHSIQQGLNAQYSTEY